MDQLFPNLVQVFMNIRDPKPKDLIYALLLSPLLTYSKRDVSFQFSDCTFLGCLLFGMEEQEKP